MSILQLKPHLVRLSAHKGGGGKGSKCPKVCPHPHGLWMTPKLERTRLKLALFEGKKWMTSINPENVVKSELQPS